MTIKHRIITVAAPITVKAVQEFLANNNIKMGKVTPVTQVQDGSIELTKEVHVSIGRSYVTVVKALPDGKLQFYEVRNSIGLPFLSDVKKALKA